MKLTIEQFWNKVVDDSSQPFGTRVLPEYERKSIVTFPNSGYTSVREWRERAKCFKGFEGFDEQGRARFDLGRSYGIHTYQIVSLEL